MERETGLEPATSSLEGTGSKLNSDRPRSAAGAHYLSFSSLDEVSCAADNIPAAGTRFHLGSARTTRSRVAISSTSTVP